MPAMVTDIACRIKRDDLPERFPSDGQIMSLCRRRTGQDTVVDVCGVAAHDNVRLAKSQRNMPQRMAWRINYLNAAADRQGFPVVKRKIHLNTQLRSGIFQKQIKPLLSRRESVETRFHIRYFSEGRIPLNIARP